VENAALDLQRRLVVMEVEAVDGELGLQAREMEAAGDGPLTAGFQFQIGQRFQGGGHAKILGRRFRQSLLQLAAHGGEAQLLKFLFQGSHGIPFGSGASRRHSPKAIVDRWPVD